MNIFLIKFIEQIYSRKVIYYNTDDIVFSDSTGYSIPLTTFMLPKCNLIIIKQQDQLLSAITIHVAKMYRLESFITR